MFLMYGLIGAWFPVFSAHLKNLGFSPIETAWACASFAISSLIAPLIWGQMADRWAPAQTCISVAAFVASTVLVGMSYVQTPAYMIASCLAMHSCAVGVVSLGTALCFRQMSNADKQFGPIRCWGTVGWVIAGFAVSAWIAMQSYFDPFSYTDYSGSMLVGAAFGFALAIYAWWLPHTPPNRKPSSGRVLRNFFDAPLQASTLLRRPSFLIFTLCLFVFCATTPFAAQMTPLLLRNLGVPESTLPATLTIGQSTEMVTLLLLPSILDRFGLKAAMQVGMAAWVTGLVVAAWGTPLWLVLSSMTAHGIYICCFFVAGQVFVNQQASADIRASVQGLIQWVNGSGVLLGNLSVGWLRESTEDDFRWCFAPAAMLTLTMTVLFISLFHEREERSPITAKL